MLLKLHSDLQAVKVLTSKKAITVDFAPLRFTTDLLYNQESMCARRQEAQWHAACFAFALLLLDLGTGIFYC